MEEFLPLKTSAKNAQNRKTLNKGSLTRLAGEALLESIRVSQVQPAAAVDSDEHFFAYLAAVILTCLYGILCLLAAFQLSRILWFGHAIMSFQSGFVALCLMSGVIRVIYLTHLGTWSGVVSLFLFWVPLDLQCTTFSLLGLYLANLLYEHEWEARKQGFIVFCITANVTLVSVTLLTIVMAHHMKTIMEVVEHGHHLYVSAVFATLAVAYARALALATQRRHLLLTRNGPSNLQHILLTIFTAFCILASRSVYNVMAWRQLVVLHVGTHMHIETASLFLLLFWEVLPSFIVLCYFRHIPKTRFKRGMCCMMCCMDRCSDLWDRIANGASPAPSNYHGSPYYNRTYPNSSLYSRGQSIHSEDELLGAKEGTVLLGAHNIKTSLSFADYDDTNYDTPPSEDSDKDVDEWGQRARDRSREVDSRLLDAHTRDDLDQDSYVFAGPGAYYQSLYREPTQLARQERPGRADRSRSGGEPEHAQLAQWRARGQEDTWGQGQYVEF
eukprot:g6343.t1